MKNAKHTPGPWKVFGHDTGYQINDAKGYVADVYFNFGKTGGEQQANADLIAAAPELLEVLKELYSAVYHMTDTSEKTGNRFPRAMAKTREAIAKAEGGAA